MRRTGTGRAEARRSGKVAAARAFEDYRLGETIQHAVPRTLSGGERALYHALYAARHALHSSDEFARASGLASAPLDDLIVLHAVAGRSAPQVAPGGAAACAIAEAVFLRPVTAGETLRAVSEVIGLRPGDEGQAGTVWLRTTGTSRGEPVLRFVRRAPVAGRGAGAQEQAASVPDLAGAVRSQDLRVPEGLDFSRYEFAMSGEPHRMGDYAVGEVIDHGGGAAVEEADAMLAARLWQDTAVPRPGPATRPDGRRPVEGGHVISLARAMSFAGLANAQVIVAINAAVQPNPCHAGDVLRAWSEVLDMAETRAPGVGAIRLRTVGVVGEGASAGDRLGADGRYLPGVVLDLDHWALMPA